MARRHASKAVSWREDPLFDIPPRDPSSFKRGGAEPFKPLRIATKYLKPKDVAAHLNIGYSTLMKHIKLKLIDAQPLRKGYRIPDYAVSDYLERLAQTKG